uniref:SWIM-type domain-containing protein n=1 Tax=Lactuca sativa TaxID=4236 RepID=A0A9R1X5V5_LACSA|nr:hypothetical protein LSAT_V11C600331860 [Lactuca sativa]
MDSSGKGNVRRDKPIISCLEFIREYMMKRICNVLKVQQKCVGPLTPTVTKIMEKNEADATQYIVEWCGDEKYQVKGPWNDQHVVDMHERVCSCRKWELTGIPCRHVISVLYNKVDHGECVHWLQTWKTAYGYKVEQIKGRTLWPRSECPMQITPPPHSNQPGRPKRKRRQSREEKSHVTSPKSRPEKTDFCLCFIKIRVLHFIKMLRNLFPEKHDKYVIKTFSKKRIYFILKRLGCHC